MLWHAGGAPFRRDSRQQFPFNRRIRVKSKFMPILGVFKIGAFLTESVFRVLQKAQFNKILS
ncbi:MAG: hypothetical protein CAK90_00520 [Spartobacteria bacterium AMD-G4]|nr:MAG: hypothetical protein CAK90_00520 [Spartobacteria bacterium AMD-G4]